MAKETVKYINKNAILSMKKQGNPIIGNNMNRP